MTTFNTAKSLRIFNYTPLSVALLRAVAANCESIFGWYFSRSRRAKEGTGSAIFRSIAPAFTAENSSCPANCTVETCGSFHLMEVLRTLPETSTPSIVLSRTMKDAIRKAVSLTSSLFMLDSDK